MDDIKIVYKKDERFDEKMDLAKKIEKEAEKRKYPFSWIYEKYNANPVFSVEYKNKNYFVITESKKKEPKYPNRIFVGIPKAAKKHFKENEENSVYLIIDKLDAPKTFIHVPHPDLIISIADKFTIHRDEGRYFTIRKNEKKFFYNTENEKEFIDYIFKNLK